MKKIAILLILLAVAFLIIPSKTYAIETFTNISDNLTWSKAAENDIVYVQTDRFMIDFSSIEIEINTSLSEHFNVFIAAANDLYSRVEIYDSVDSQIILDWYYIAYEIPSATEMMYSFGDDGIGLIDVTQYTGKYMQIVLLTNPDPAVVVYGNIDFYLNNYRTEYSFNINKYHIINPATTVDTLPFTAGNPNPDFVSLKMGEGLDWAYDTTTNTFAITIRYFEDFMLTIPNITFGDDAFIDKVQSINYYTIGTEKYLQFNFLNSGNALLTRSQDYQKQWNGYAVWNLTTNELVVYNRALALTYIDITDSRDVYAYLYIPNIPIDDLITVAGHFNYRYGYTNFLGQQRYYDWETSVFVLEKDRASYGATSVFEGALPQWSYDLLENSAAAFGIAGMIINKIPELSATSFYLNLASFGMIPVVAGGIQKVATGNISEIETITPSTTLKTILNNHYTLASNSLTILPSDAQVHKLYLGSFTKYQTNAVEPDPSSFIYTEITWTTAGQIYTLDERFIDSQAILDIDDQANLPPEDAPFVFDWSQLSDTVKAIAIIAVVVVIFVILPSVDKGLTAFTNITKNPRKLLMTIIIAFIILLLLGVLVI